MKPEKAATMKKDQRQKRKRIRPVWAAAALVLVCAHCSRGTHVQFEIYPEVQLRQEPYSFRTQACRDTIEVLLTEVWGSDFFNWENPLLLEEILDNNYGIFECETHSEEMAQYRAFYKKEKTQDRIMLNKRLFRHFAASRGCGFRLRDMDRRIKSTLVHELMHDFWFNVLDDRLKEGFVEEAQVFLAEVSRAGSRSERIAFLKEAGYQNPAPSDFLPFAELEGLRDRYSAKELHGTELYSILADRAFSGHILIPRRFHAYYRDILSEGALARMSK
jgi:hypothetical protein